MAFETYNAHEAQETAESREINEKLRGLESLINYEIADVETQNKENLAMSEKLYVMQDDIYTKMRGLEGAYGPDGELTQEELIA